MNLKGYYTVELGEKLSNVLSKIKRNEGHINFSSYEPPVNLAGNQKVITLHFKSSFNNIIKIDGPGFIIQEIYDYFSK